MATDSRFKMSQERYDALKEELQYLETDKAKEVSEQIKEARSWAESRFADLTILRFCLQAKFAPFTLSG